MTSQPQHNTITRDMMVLDVLRAYPKLRGVFDRYGLRGCGGSLGPAEAKDEHARRTGIERARSYVGR